AWLSKGRRYEAVELIDAYLMADPEDSDFLHLKVQVTEEPVAEKAERPSLKGKPAEVEKPPVFKEEPLAPIAGKAAPHAAAERSAGGLEPDVEALFQGFRQGGQTQVSDQHEMRYDLGVAYKEMGLLAEALEEFRQAACAPTRFLDACAMMAA